MNLQDYANLATVLTFLVAFAAAIFGLYQVGEMKRSLHLNSFLAVVSFLQDERVRAARDTLIKLDGKPLPWSDAERKAADLALRKFNATAIIVRKGLIPLHFVLPEWGNSLRLCWAAGQPLIDEYRSGKRGERYWHELESLVRLGDREV